MLKLLTQNLKNKKFAEIISLKMQQNYFSKKSLELSQIPPINRPHLAEQNHFRIAVQAG
jgi:hypothetical protein